MLAINDAIFPNSYFDARFVDFERMPHLQRCAGRRFAVCLPETERWLSLCLYLRQNGASVAPLHPSTPWEAAKRLARRMRCSQLLFHDETSSIQLDDSQRDDAGMLVQLSSGTTGEPKCVERSWASVDDEVAGYVDALGELGTRTPLLACPVTHSYGLISGVLAALRRGAMPVILTHINPKYLLRRASADQRAILYASPTLLNVLVRLLPAGTKLCAVMTSGAPLRAAWFRELRERSARVLQQYGCSELGCISLNLNTQGADEIGLPLRHLDVTAGPSKDAPEEIRVRVGERFASTKDLGYFNARGLCFVSRVDDTINVAGINVYPREVEEVILEFSGIEEAVVYKRADPYAGERVCLKFTAEQAVDVSELRQFCVQQLTPFAVPLEMQQVSFIPKLENGKINRRQLAEPTEELPP
ncbi:MAG TPA: AMP-binding protein [Polyangiaceae bacterium]|nr:AMP-binding protein [Polyangiaceae bacterium]